MQHVLGHVVRPQVLTMRGAALCLLYCVLLQGTHTKKLVTASDMSALFEATQLQPPQQMQQTQQQTQTQQQQHQTQQQRSPGPRSRL